MIVADLSNDDARLAYAESAQAARKVIDVGGPMAIYNLLTNIGSGLPFDAAFERAVLMPYPEFLKTWAD